MGQSGYGAWDSRDALQPTETTRRESGLLLLRRDGTNSIGIYCDLWNEFMVNKKLMREEAWC